MIKQYFKESLIVKILTIFLIVQPFLDFYLLFSDNILDITVFSPSTIIRVIVIPLLCVMTILHVNLFKRKEFKYYLIYTFAIFIYMGLSYYNSFLFDVTLPTEYKYSLLREGFYVARMILPIMVIIITFYNKFKEETIVKVFYTVSGLFSVTIVVTNLLKFSLASYDSSNSTWITANIIDWFTKSNDLIFKYLASKGFFVSANQISCLLVMLLPMLLYYYFPKPNKVKTTLILTHILSMICLGTRVATHGWVLVVAAYIFISLFFMIVRKNVKFGAKSWGFGVIVLVALIILVFSPINYRASDDDYLEKEKLKEIIDINNGGDCNHEYLSVNYEAYSLPRQYVEEIYPMEKDTAFWCSYIEKPFSKRVGNRNLQINVTQRISSINNNSLDKIVGIGFSRLTSGNLYIERDILVHCYSIGVFGILLFIMPYVFIILYSSYKCLKEYNKNFTLKNVTLLMASTLCIAVSVFSGHVLDELIVTIFLGFILGLLLNSVVFGEGE